MNIFEDTSLFDVVEEDSKVWVIKDKYPKGLVHLLVVPKIKIVHGVDDLRADHIELIEHMKMIVEKILTRNSSTKFLVGFHAIPSLWQLHLHIVSRDLSGVKTKKHRNSFTESFMLTPDYVLDKLRTVGHIHVDKDYFSGLLKA